MNRQQQTDAFVANHPNELAFAKSLQDWHFPSIDADQAVYDAEYANFNAPSGTWEWEYFVPNKVKEQWNTLPIETRLTIYFFCKERSEQAAFQDTFGFSE